jgi:hypothetical protein
MGVIARRELSVGGLAWGGVNGWGAACGVRRDARPYMQELRSPRNQASQGKRAIGQAGPWRYIMWAVSLKDEAEGMHTPHTRGSTHHGCWVWCGVGLRGCVCVFIANDACVCWFRNVSSAAGIVRSRKFESIIQSVGPGGGGSSTTALRLQITERLEDSAGLQQVEFLRDVSKQIFRAFSAIRTTLNTRAI